SAICIIAALASLLRGKRYVYGQEKSATEAATVQDVITSQEEASSAL
ncbi:MAG: hypothetical protein JO011_21320, partial [Ktedonobacteraceae bacterium]|nr:hypothetical protein [Ktedonobacteraceae bacterium]